MPNLLWDDVRNFVAPDLMGALPDVSVTDTSVDDWQAVFDLAASSGWTWEYAQGCVRMPLPSAQEVLSRPTDADTALLKVRPVANVQVNFWPMSAGEIDFDVDLRELQGQERVDVLCGLPGTIGRRLGRPVLMTGGGNRGKPLLGFDPRADRVVLLADPLGV